MSVLNTEFFIARRLSSRSEKGRGRVMVSVAVTSVAVSVAVMIIAMSVIYGFKRELTDKLVGFGGNIQIVNLDGNSSFETMPVRRSPILESSIPLQDHFGSMYGYAVKGGIIKTDDAIQGIMLKGYGPEFDWEFYSRNLTRGTLPDINDSIRNKEIMVSEGIATIMELDVEDRVEMLFIMDDAPPRRDRFKVTGIYSTGFEEMDQVTVPTDIRNVLRISNWEEDQITGYEIFARRYKDGTRLYDKVYDLTVEASAEEGQNLMALRIEDRYPGIFDWLKAHNVNGAVIITIMLVVALLNMISTLLIIILEKTRMIGMLKAMGMNNGSLNRLFIMRSSYIIGKGMLWGNIIGLGLCLIQSFTHIVKLDQSGYFLSAVPVFLDPLWIILLNLITFVVLLALLAVPTMIVSRVRPGTTIRYQ